MQIYDLSMLIESGMATYPGDPWVLFEQAKSYEKDGINVLSLCLGTHTGTHVDAPKHHLKRGKDVANFSLEKFVGEAAVFRLEKGENEPITAEDLKGENIRTGDIVIISTGWEKNINGATYFKNFPYFSPDTADYLIDKKIKAIGCDMPSVDVPKEVSFHRKILNAGIGIIEALGNLQSLAGKRVFFIGLPLKIASGDGSPVRAIAIEKMI